jgi:hypothetical protein
VHAERPLRKVDILNRLPSPSKKNFASAGPPNG